MTLKRIKQPAIAGAVLAVLALSGSALAGVATAAGGSSSTASTDVPSVDAGAAPASATGVGGGSVESIDYAGDGRTDAPYLTDHERYLSHHRRLTSA